MDATDTGLWSLIGLAFALGLTHGADPDHLTAIDGMTRASVDRHPRLSRWVGTWFAFGHSLSVLSIAALIALAAEHFGPRSASVQQVSWLVSALLLFVIGTINLMGLFASAPGKAARNGGLMAHLLPRQVLNVAHPLSAVPIGALFGLGFETASQMSAWALAGTVGYGLQGALLIGAAFSIGMVITDSVNGLVVRRLYLTAAQSTLRNGRTMTLTVIGLAYGIGAVKLLQQTSLALPVTDVGLTVMVLVTLSLAFAVAMRRVKRPIFLSS